jgi:hypothetical protein
MRFVLTLSFLMTLGLVAEDRIPAGATEVTPYTYRDVDAQGQTWMYRQTPFGLTKWRPSDVPPPRVKFQNAVTATDLGDSVRFERKTPFGDYVWTKKKVEMTADESSLLAIAAGETEKK